MIWWERLCEKKESANRQAVQGKLNLESQSALAKKAPVEGRCRVVQGRDRARQGPFFGQVYFL